MKKISLLVTTIILLFFINSCKKDTTTNPTNTGFTWTYNGTTYTADSAYYNNTYNTMFAFKNKGTATSKFFEINLDNGTVGTHNLTTGGLGGFNYIEGSTSVPTTTFKVVVSANASSKITGTFAADISGGQITGSFTDIRVD